MHIPQLLDPLALAPHVEIVKPRLPDMHRPCVPERILPLITCLTRPSQYPLRETLFYDLHDFGWVPHLRFADQEVKVLGHDHITEDHEAIPFAGLLEDAQEQVATQCSAEPGLPAVTAAGDEMEVSGAVISVQPFGHGGIVGWGRSLKQ